MKASFAILFLLFVLTGFPAQAQENEMPVTEPLFLQGNNDNDLNDDKPLLFEQDSKLIKRDSVVSRGTAIQKTKADQKTSSSKNDDALSFNFLYYIIQKFKFSDLIDN